MNLNILEDPLRKLFPFESCNPILAEFLKGKRMDGNKTEDISR